MGYPGRHGLDGILMTNDLSEHEIWLAETWQMIERCATSMNQSEQVRLSTAGCAALLAERRDMRETAEILAAEVNRLNIAMCAAQSERAP